MTTGDVGADRRQAEQHEERHRGRREARPGKDQTGQSKQRAAIRYRGNCFAIRRRRQRIPVHSFNFLQCGETYFTAVHGSVMKTALDLRSCIVEPDHRTQN